MKFGVIMHKTTQNIGDDIQTFAAKCNLPQVDYFLDREELDNFVTPDGKPIAVIMSAWYMWKKWNWPPSEYIIPLLTGIHYSDHQLSKQSGSPVNKEFLTGIGGEYMNAYGPVGCRDLHTLDKFRDLGIDAFFSGCITLTLPKMKIKKPEKEYICAADLPFDVYNKLEQLLEGTGIELIKTTHYYDYRESDDSWEVREERVVKLLTLYQNAKCVVTRRLHCALPCLAMGVPVFVTNGHKRPVSGRFAPYYDWVPHCTYKQFVAGKFNYDFTNPPPNSDKYVAVREAMIESIKAFVNKYKDEDGLPEQYKKTSYTDEELYKWRCETMRECMNKWLPITIDEENELVQLRSVVSKLDEDDLRKQVKTQKKRAEDAERKLARAERILSCRSVKATIKLRNVFVSEDKKIKL